MLKGEQILQNCFQVLSHHQHSLTSWNNPPIQIKQHKTSHINVCMVKIIKSIYKYLKFQLCCEILIFMCWISNAHIYVLFLSIEYHSTMNICSILHPVLRASAKIFAFFTITAAALAAQENYFYVALATNANDAMRWK